MRLELSWLVQAAVCVRMLGRNATARWRGTDPSAGGSGGASVWQESGWMLAGAPFCPVQS